METVHRIFRSSSARMSELDDASIDLVVTSPPYPMVEMWDRQFGEADPEIASVLERGDGEAAFAGMHRLLDAVWEECGRTVKPGGFVCVNIGDAVRTAGGVFRLFDNHARIAARFLDLGFHELPLVLWRKTTNAPNKFMGSGMLPAGAYVTLEHEFVLIFRKGGKRDFVSAEDKLRRRESAFFWEERNRWFIDLWDLGGRRQALGGSVSRERSAAFPFELAYRLVNMYSVRGDTVLDPFLGTGTTLAAALACGRNGAGCEIEPGLADEAAKTILSCRDEANRATAGRLARHREFLAEAEAAGRSVKHANARYGFKVVTSQETDLRLDFVAEVEDRGGGVFIARYRDDPPESGPLPSGGAVPLNYDLFSPE